MTPGAGSDKYLIGLALLGVFGMFLLRGTCKLESNLSCASTRGEIISVKWRNLKERNIYNRYEVKYKYRVGDQEYPGSDIVTFYPRSQVVTVYYHKKSPKASSLSQYFPLPDFFLAIGSLVALGYLLKVEVKAHLNRVNSKSGQPPENK